MYVVHWSANFTLKRWHCSNQQLSLTSIKASFSLNYFLYFYWILFCIVFLFQMTLYETSCIKRMRHSKVKAMLRLIISWTCNMFVVYHHNRLINFSEKSLKVNNFYSERNLLLYVYKKLLDRSKNYIFISLEV